jgi:organic radical activating enzyme
MDFTTKEIFKRYASILVGKPISPVFLNILVTSVCDMRCTHCFFTEELDDRPRKKLQMKANEIARISETLGGNLGVLVLAGGEPFTRKDLPEIVRAFYENIRASAPSIRLPPTNTSPGCSEICSPVWAFRSPIRNPTAPSSG